MKLNKIIVLVVMSLSISNLSSQNPKEIFFDTQNYYKWQAQFVSDNALTNITTIYQFDFVESDGFTFSYDKLKRGINQWIPNVNDTGMARLDWEGLVYNVISGDESTPEFFNKCLDQFIAVLEFSKLLRPKMKWSLYGMPPTSYYPYNEKSDPLPVKSMRLMQMMDYFNPTLYFNEANKTVDQMFLDQNIEATLKYSLTLGIKLSKPVYPAIWNRYSNNKLIDLDSWKKMMIRMVNTKINSKGLDGVIMWQCEDFLYANPDAVITEEYKNVTNVNSYITNMMKSYMDAIKPVLNP